MNITSDIILGKSEEHVSAVYKNVKLHLSILDDFKSLQMSAENDGIKLTPVSGFRSFDRQLKIWNDKCLGLRPVLDNEGKTINIKDLSEFQITQAILRWSALPGASRHHWGTDFDVVDLTNIDPSQPVDLLISDGLAGGKFENLNLWIKENSSKFGFYRPYEIDKGGIAPEWWHLSHIETSKLFEKFRTKDLVIDAIRSSEILLKETVLENFDFLYETYIK